MLPAHGFLLDHGIYSTIDVPGSLYTEANRINDCGQIVGWFRDAIGTHRFIAMPIP
jgi:hypothetical protein